MFVTETVRSAAAADWAMIAAVDKASRVFRIVDFLVGMAVTVPRVLVGRGRNRCLKSRHSRRAGMTFGTVPPPSVCFMLPT